MNKKGEMKMKLKKTLSMVLTCLMVLSLTVACQKKDSPSESQQASTNQTTQTDHKTLVVYYSATGTTKDVANMIASATGGDLFEIQPKDAYTSDDLDWTNDNSRVTREHEDESLRNVELVSTTVDNWDSYDRVFIGYPIWWGIAAWPVDNFVKNNDFQNKTVIPFCTSASSGLGESGQLLADMAKSGNWQDGQRFSSGATQDEVQEWINQLK